MFDDHNFKFSLSYLWMELEKRADIAECFLEQEQRSSSGSMRELNAAEVVAILFLSKSPCSICILVLCVYTVISMLPHLIGAAKTENMKGEGQKGFSRMA